MAGDQGATELIEPEAQSFLGTVLWDDRQTAAYRLDRFLGGGGMSLTYLATRRTSGSEGYTVVKVMRPSFLRSASNAATLAMRKEAEALRRLSERTPPNPCIVRLVDAGSLAAKNVQVPWLALEYVHGGPEGSTLGERVRTSVETHGQSFDLVRVARVMDQLQGALGEVHAAGIIHRDLKPENVLVCGVGVDEIFKLADFGIARATGMEATFGVGIGTLGYAAPEQLGIDASKIGPWTDVFGLAATMFFVLSGIDAYDTSGRKRRLRSLEESPHLCDDLRGRPSALKALDELFQRALSARIEDRPQTARLFASAFSSISSADSRQVASIPLLRRRTLTADVAQGLHFSLVHEPTHERVIRGVAWNSDGRCLAATNHGLEFWNGEQWTQIPLAEGPLSHGLRVVHRLAPGEWLVGGDQASLALFGPEGVREVLRGPDVEASIQLFSGDLDDLAVLGFVKPGEPPTLYTLCHGRWLKPLTLDDVATLNSIARVGDAEWFVAGRKVDGRAFAALFRPLFWEITEVECAGRALLGCAAERSTGVVVAGSVDGVVLSRIDDTWAHTEVAGRPAIASVAIDPLERRYLGTPGRLWLGVGDAPYTPVWSRDGAPVVSIYADGGVVYAMTADGAIVEGRPVAR